MKRFTNGDSPPEWFTDLMEEYFLEEGFEVLNVDVPQKWDEFISAEVS